MKRRIVRKNIKLTALLLFFLWGQVFGSITVKSEIDTTIATIGDQITLKISVLYPRENTTISFPDINDELQNFSLISRQDYREKIATGFQKDFYFKVAVFDTGKIEIPPLTVGVQSDSAETKTFKSASHFLNVVSILPPDENVAPKDIKKPFPLPKVLPWELIIFILVILAISVTWYLLYKKWKKDHPAIAFDEKYLDPPHIIALKKLRKIESQPFSTEKEKINVYTALSHILREYLENRFFLRALEMPTREILESASTLELPGASLNQLQHLLSRLDIIKFANQLPQVSDKDEIIEIIREMISTTQKDNFLSQRSGLTEAKEALQED